MGGWLIKPGANDGGKKVVSSKRAPKSEICEDVSI